MAITNDMWFSMGFDPMDPADWAAMCIAEREIEIEASCELDREKGG